MSQSALDTLRTFDITSLPDLDVVVEGALELFLETELPRVGFGEGTRLLVLGSVNALQTGKIVFDKNVAYFGDESTYMDMLAKYPDADHVIVVSASGGKHAVPIAASAAEQGKSVILFTNNPEAPARAHVAPEQVYVFPRNREPYSYNTSTYLGMILAGSGEDPAAILSHLRDKVAGKLLRNVDHYGAFTSIVPSHFSHIVPMVRTKFDELFGPAVVGRVFTEEEVKHAKTIVESPDELFISFGVENAEFGIPKHRLFVPLMEGGGYAAALATTYFVVGKIQAAHPPYFKNGIERYAQKVSAYFHQNIPPIVE